MNNAKIKFSKISKSSKWSDPVCSVLVNKDGEWVELAKMTAVMESYYMNDGSQRELVSYYHTTVEGVFVSAEVRSGSRYCGGELVQSAASAKSQMKSKIIEALQA